MLPGQSYTWTLVARHTKGQRATTSVSKVVNVALPPIAVDGALGPDRTASIRSNLQLTASPTDPLDTISPQSAPWTFKWSCLRRCWGAKVPCDPAVEGEPCGDHMGLARQTGQSVTVMAGAMEDGYRYLFQTLIAREPLFDGNGAIQEGRVRVAGVIIDAVDAQNNPVLHVSISGEPAGGAINAHEPLVLGCEGVPSGGTIVWEMERGDLPDGYSLNEVALSNGGLSPTGQRQLVVPPDSFTPGQEIEISCAVVSSDGRASGRASVPLFVRPIPRGGTMSLLVRSAGQSSASWQPLDAAKPMDMAQAGTSLVDSNGDGIGDIFVGNFEELSSLFRVSAVGWTYPGKEILGGEVQPSLKYQFFYRVGDGQRVPFSSIQVTNSSWRGQECVKGQGGDGGIVPEKQKQIPCCSCSVVAQGQVTQGAAASRVLTHSCCCMQFTDRPAALPRLCCPLGLSRWRWISQARTASPRPITTPWRSWCPSLPPACPRSPMSCTPTCLRSERVRLRFTAAS